VGESAVIRTQMGKHIRPVMVAVLGTPCAISPRNSNGNSNMDTDLAIVYPITSINFCLERLVMRWLWFSRMFCREPIRLNIMSKMAMRNVVAFCIP
jgi:hypothetical protein